MATQETIKQLNVGGVLRDVEDVTARGLISSLQAALNALTSGDTTTAIESFNEIVAFLENTSDSSTLQGIIAGLNTSIAAKYTKPDTGIPASDLAQAVQTILNSVANKANSADVYPKSQTYNKSEVDGLVANASGTQGPKGDTGNVEITDAGNLVTILVNDLTTGGAGNILSAEMGKRLALMSGTYAQAWARSKAIPFPFCFLWNETVDGDAISKPIWHKGNSVFIDAAGAIVNVEAASVPAAPTITGATSGDTVPKNTQITITPASGSALYYSLDGGTTYNVSDAAVTITLGTAGSVSIVAYCANNKGNSSNTTLSVTVAGTDVPTFSPNGGEVSRGGSVTISVPTGGELHYKVDSGSWITASGTSVSVTITGATTIQAYNVQDGDTSDTITKSFTMAALASPTFSVATGTEFPATGGSVELTGPTDADIYYTTNGDTPTTSSTKYTGTAIAVNANMTIKAIAHDTYGDSAVAEASYTVKEAGISVKTNAATTMTITNTDDTTIEKSLVSGDNFFGFTELGGSSFKTVAFGDKNALVELDFGGATFSVFGGSTASPISQAANLIKVVGLTITGNANKAFNFLQKVTLIDVVLQGITKAKEMFLLTGSSTIKPVINMDLSFSTSCAFNGAFSQLYIDDDTIDLSSCDFGTITTANFALWMFYQCHATTLIVGSGFSFVSNAATSQYSIFAQSLIDTIKMSSSTPPTISGKYDWVSDWVDTGSASTKTIQVPTGSLSAYQSAFGHVNDVTWVEY